MNRSKEYRREIIDSGSPMAHHSMNQYRERLTRDGEQQHLRGESKKVLRARARAAKNRQKPIVDEASNGVGVAPKGIIFAEELGFK